MALNICVDKQSSPKELRDELKAQIDTTELHLGGTGYLDYLWYGHDGMSFTYERKTVSDLSGRVDDLEKQLRNALNVADRVGLIIEGIHEPKDGKTRMYKKKQGIFIPTRGAFYPYAYYAGFLWRLSEAGIPVFYTATAKTTAHFLAEAVKLSNRPESKVFSRYIKRKVDVKEQTPQVQNLVNLGIGEKTAALLIERFGTIWNVLNVSHDSELLAVDGIGKRTVEKLKELVGK